MRIHPQKYSMCEDITIKSEERKCDSNWKTKTARSHESFPSSEAPVSTCAVQAAESKRKGGGVKDMGLFLIGRGAPHHQMQPVRFVRVISGFEE